jgi:hypothetical protein
VTNGQFRPEYESRIREGLRQRLHAPIEVTIEYLPFMPPERSGKFRHVVSEVPIDRVLRPNEAATGR